MSPAGSDSATGDSLNPVATFTGALNRLAAWSDGQQGALLHRGCSLSRILYRTNHTALGRFQLPGRQR
jgi:hypothetical protein